MVKNQAEDLEFENIKFTNKMQFESERHKNAMMELEKQLEIAIANSNGLDGL